jgi:aminocarboxymuconate-semialdehyde decarboxylase
MYKNGQFFRRIEQNCWCLSARCVDMHKTNVTSQVLSTVPVMFNYWAKPNDCMILLYKYIYLIILIKYNDTS